MKYQKNKKYTGEDWKKEMKQNKFCGKHPNWFHSGCYLECPNCGNRGFYGPKLIKNDEGKITRKYRACKFCGFWQEVSGSIYNNRGGEPYRCVMVFCNDCGAYDWRTPWSDNYGSCNNCGQSDCKKVDWPTENPDHKFYELKQIMDKAHNNL